MQASSDNVAAAIVGPAPLHRPTATLTPKGHAVLGLIHEQDALPASDHAGRARIDVLISTLLEVPALA